MVSGGALGELWGSSGGALGVEKENFFLGKRARRLGAVHVWQNPQKKNEKHARRLGAVQGWQKKIAGD